MTYEQITNRNLAEGPHVYIQYVNDITAGLFMSLAIAVIYLTFALGMYFAQTRMRGKGDAPACFAVSSYVMIGFLVILGMIPGIVNGIMIIEVIILAVVSTFWLYFSKNSAEAY